MGLDGNIGTISVDLNAQTATATGQHTIDQFAHAKIRIISRQYPFCATGAASDSNSLRSAAALVPFYQELNRLTLIVTNGSAPRYRIQWGRHANDYSANELSRGINLADEFAENPFSEPFGNVDRAVAAKQAFETQQIQRVFHSKEFQSQADELVAKTEKERAILVNAIRDAFMPVTHTITITPLNR